MALNGSGAISLGGSTAGQSIAVELNLSPTGQISLNDTAVRTLAGVASGAITMPTNFWGKSNSPFGPVSSLSTSANYTYAVYVGGDKYVLSYYSNSVDAYYAVVCTISGSSVSFGTPVLVSATGLSSSSSGVMYAAYHAAADKVVFAYREFNTNYNLYAIVGTVSGTTISFGTRQFFSGTTQGSIYPVVYDSSTQLLIFFYRGTSSYVYAQVASLSGTVLTFSSEYTVFSAAQTEPQAVYVPAQSRTYIAAQGTSRIIETSAPRNLTFRATASYASSNMYVGNNMAVSGSNVVLIVRNAFSSPANIGTAYVATIGATSISYTGPVDFTTTAVSVNWNQVTYDAAKGTFVFTYQLSSNFYGHYRVATLSGTTLTFTTPQTAFTSENYNHSTTAYASTPGKVVIAYAFTALNTFTFSSP